MYKYSYNPRREQKQRSLISFKTKLILLFLFLSLGGLFYFFLLSSLFRVTDLEIVGNKKISATEIEKIVEDYINRRFLLFWKPRNIFLVNSAFISQSILDKQLLADEILVKKEGTDKIKIIVKERRIFAIWCSIEITNKKLQISNDDEVVVAGDTDNDSAEINDSETRVDECFYIDRKGIAFSEAPESSGSLILVIKEAGVGDINLGDRVLENKIIDFIQDLSVLIEGKSLQATEFLIKNKLSRDIEVVMAGGWTAYFNTNYDLGSQVNIADKTLNEKISIEDRKNLEYIDLRIPDRVYYK